MKRKNYFQFVYLGIINFLLVVTCSNDDEDFVPVELNDRTEQQAADKDSLLNYFSTHYYNASDFEDTSIDYTIDDIVISELPKDENGNYLPLPDPENNRLLSEDGVLTTYVESYLDVEYEYYVLEINEGGGEKNPNFTDKVRATYEGSFVEDGEVFDSAIQPVDFNLVGGLNSSGVITGWQRVFPKFLPAESFTSNGDGTVNYTNYGLGVMFLPSGLAYFGGSTNIPAYSNLIFKFTFLQTEVNDHDNDGIPSYLEDINNNFDVTDDDTEEDLFPDYVDPDDDDDGVSTIDEIVFRSYVYNPSMGDPEPNFAQFEYELNRTEVDGNITVNTVDLIDSDGNGVPDYRDEEITINYNDDSDS